MKHKSSKPDLKWYQIPSSTKWWLSGGMVAILVGSLVIQMVVNVLYVQAATPVYQMTSRFGQANLFTNATDFAATTDGGFAVIGDFGDGTTRKQVTRLDATGRVLFVIADNDKFQAPYKIAVDSHNNIYVASALGTTTHRVTKYDANGNKVSEYALYAYPTSAGHLTGDPIVSLAVDNDGNVYIADAPTQPSDARIQKFAPDGTFIARFGSLGSADGSFNSLHSIAVSGSTLYAGDNSGIQTFDLNGNYSGRFAATGAGDARVSTADRIVINSGGMIAVANYQLVKYYQQDGSYVGKTSSQSSIIAASSADFYILVSGEIHKIDAAGSDALVLSGNSGASVNQVSALAGDPQGNIYALDSGNVRIQKFNSSGALQKTIPLRPGAQSANTIGVTVDNNENIYVIAAFSGCDNGSQYCIRKFNAQGNFVSQINNLPYSTSITTDGVGKLYVAYGTAQNTKMIGVYGFDGSLLSTFGISGYGAEGDQLSDIRQMVYSQDALYVIGGGYSGYIKQFSADGIYIKTAVPNVYGYSSFTMNTTGGFLLCDGTNVKRYSSDGLLVENLTLDKPGNYLVGAPQGGFYVSETKNSTIAKYDQVTIHAPAAPVDVAVTNIVKTAATISWTHPPSSDFSNQATKYKFRVREQGAASDVSIYGSTDITATTATIMAGYLRPGATYDVYVSAGNIDGYGPEAKVTFTTEPSPPRAIGSVEFSEDGGKQLIVTGSGLVGGDDNPAEYIVALDHSLVRLNNIDLPFCSQYGFGMSAQQLIDGYSSYYPNLIHTVSDAPPCYELIKDGQAAITTTQAIIHLPDNFDTTAQGTVSVNGSPVFTFNKQSNIAPTVAVNGTKPLAEHPKVPKLPVFSGMAAPHAVVTVTVHSDPVVCTATASVAGYWSCTLPTELPDGEHMVNVRIVNSDSSIVDIGPYPVTVGDIPLPSVIPLTDKKMVIAKVQEAEQKQQEQQQETSSKAPVTNQDIRKKVAPAEKTQSSNAGVVWGIIGVVGAVLLGVSLFIILVVRRRQHRKK